MSSAVTPGTKIEFIKSFLARLPKPARCVSDEQDIEQVSIKLIGDSPFNFKGKGVVVSCTVAKGSV